MSSWKLTATGKRRVVELYLEGHSSVVLGKRFGVSDMSIRGLLKRRGIPRRDVHGAARTCLLNDSAFSVINEESAYWAGFLMADGCVIDRGTTPELVLSCKESDREHIEEYRKFLGSTHKLCRIAPDRSNQRGWENAQPAIRIAIKSVKLCADLARFGIVPRKSLSAKADLLQYDRHFWRGVMDGDGCVYNSIERGKVIPALRLVGSQSIIEQFIEFVKTFVPQTKATARPAKRIWCVGFHHRIAVAIFEQLYGGCTIALPRKLAIARRYIAN